jgi:hypothetical protein
VGQRARLHITYTVGAHWQHCYCCTAAHYGHITEKDVAHIVADTLLSASGVALVACVAVVRNSCDVSTHKRGQSVASI